MQVQRRAKGWEAVQVVSQGEGQGTRRLARGRMVSHIYLIYLSIRVEFILKSCSNFYWHRDLG